MSKEQENNKIKKFTSFLCQNFIFRVSYLRTDTKKFTSFLCLCCLFMVSCSFTRIIRMYEDGAVLECRASNKTEARLQCEEQAYQIFNAPYTTRNIECTQEYQNKSSCGVVSHGVFHKGLVLTSGPYCSNSSSTYWVCTLDFSVSQEETTPTNKKTMDAP